MTSGGSMETLWIVNLAFKSICPDEPTSLVYVQEGLPAVGKCLKATQHVPSHTFMKAQVSHRHEVSSHEFFHYCIITMNTALQFHWSLSNSEASPRIWTCVTRPRGGGHEWPSRICGGSGHETTPSPPPPWQNQSPKDIAEMASKTEKSHHAKSQLWACSYSCTD